MDINWLRKECLDGKEKRFSKTVNLKSRVHHVLKNFLKNCESSREIFGDVLDLKSLITACGSFR